MKAAVESTEKMDPEMLNPAPKSDYGNRHRL